MPPRLSQTAHTLGYAQEPNLVLTCQGAHEHDRPRMRITKLRNTAGAEHGQEDRHRVGF